MPLAVKALVRRRAQQVLGFDRYLDLFARYKLIAFPWSGQGRDFLRFLSLLPREGLVLDVGANVGFTTALLARRVRPGVVHAFEPSPSSAAALARLVRRQGLGNVVLHRCALGNEEGPVEMVTPLAEAARLPGLTHVVREGAAEEPGERFAAECLVLDRMADWFEPGSRVVALKIDVEDYEFEVLDGARRLLASHRPFVFCELWDTANRRRCLQLARELDYSVRVNVESRLEPFDPSRHQKLDFFLLPAERTAE